LRVNYKSSPFHNRGLREVIQVWRPVLTIQLIHNHATSKRFEALVDTGTDYCLFDARIGASIGIKVNNGPEGDLGGIVPGAKSTVYFHNVKLVVATEMVEIKAGFSWDLTSNLLGQVGFFDNFVATFDWAPNPPCFDLQRIQRN
jgi:hypothetical protein